jgi:hypothetical protein
MPNVLYMHLYIYFMIYLTFVSISDPIASNGETIIQ